MIPGIIAGGAVMRGGTPPVEPDPLWEHVVLLINGVGSIYDAKGHAITAHGTVGIDTSDSDFPGGAIRLNNGGAAYLSLADSADFDLPGDFTIEFDHKPLARQTYSAMFHMYGSYGANGGVGFFDAHAGLSGNTVAAINGSFPNLATAQQSIGVKRRYRYVRSGSTLSLYIDDSFVASQTRTGTLNAVGGVWVGTGGDGPGVYYSNSRMGRIRITRAARTEPQGTAPYPTTGP